jgi:hypothetical protein
MCFEMILQPIANLSLIYGTLKINSLVTEGLK